MEHIVGRDAMAKTIVSVFGPKIVERKIKNNAVWAITTI
jgi:hypothetical protein